ncbi:transcriptional regulator [Sphingomonas sp. DBB INV C78]|uniref:TetR/AcrR family transcriptional regulator n=1 Tax=Sphingomonas sp. DBB INV C78 TaxID=3349434 RepID=UPI0036D3B770
MPRIVDHEARRRDVARIAARLIAAAGLDGVTVRDIAREAGFSTAVVSHYFQNKRELLLFVYRNAMLETVVRVRKRRDRGNDIQKCLEAILPLDRSRRDNWKVWFAFWGMALEDAHFMAEQLQRGREARQLIYELLETASNVPARSPEERDMQARRLLATVTGLSSQSTYDPVDWPRARLCALLAAEIAALG